MKEDLLMKTAGVVDLEELEVLSKVGGSDVQPETTPITPSSAACIEVSIAGAGFLSEYLSCGKMCQWVTKMQKKVLANSVGTVDIGELEMLAKVGGSDVQPESITTVTVSSADCVIVSYEGLTFISQFNSCVGCK